jgi:hypothetical protein
MLSPQAKEEGCGDKRSSGVLLIATGNSGAIVCMYTEGRWPCAADHKVQLQEGEEGKWEAALAGLWDRCCGIHSAECAVVLSGVVPQRIDTLYELLCKVRFLAHQAVSTTQTTKSRDGENRFGSDQTMGVDEHSFPCPPPSASRHTHLVRHDLAHS